MEKMGLNEIRTSFRDFYVSKGHYPHKSFSLVPHGDKSLLLINSGMAPLKPYFAGLETPPSVRMTTCQKCLRTGDLENVGRTARHGTFFEMLGSFSFGDYFKRESLVWGWEYVTEVLKLPVDKIWASIYEDDDEAYELWVNEVGIAPERIVRMGKEDNFWEIGTGPCGPCSEMYFDRGERYGCGSPDCKPGCDCDRYVEFWNHVFTQFNRDEEGNYTPLAHPNIDTGMGLERLACIMQDTDSIFDVDTIRHILEGVTAASGVAYQNGAADTDVALRIITDHIRSVVFLIADGVIPLNEGRGYVLRRLLRRAAVQGRKLGIKGMFLSKLARRVVAVSGAEYEELVEKSEYIYKLIDLEEERFAATIDQGAALLDGYVGELKARGETRLAGDKVFKLYDTYGFNPELTREILFESGMDIDEAGYQAEMKQRQESSREGMRTSDAEAWSGNDQLIADLPKTEFLGYDMLNARGKVLRVFEDGSDVFGSDSPAKASDASPDQVAARCTVVLDKTPFYAEGGGQAFDTGTMTWRDGNARVVGVRKQRGVFLHELEIEEGALLPNTEVDCAVNAARRYQTARNHTATHLLHKALRQRLGEHVQQAGSAVDEHTLRFDFTHYEGISADDLANIEYAVNAAVNAFLPVEISELSLDEARKKGATALFDEKYGDRVRVVEVGDFSIELCGGTHVRNSGEIGAFKIVSESSVGSGTRRIEALTGTNILRPLAEAEQTIVALGGMLKTNAGQITAKVADLQKETKALRGELEQFRKEGLGDTIDGLIADARQIGAALLVRHRLSDAGSDELRALCDALRARVKNAVVALSSVNEGKVTFIVAVSDALLEQGFHAGNFVKEMAAAAGGGGGGKADLAQAGAKDPAKIDDAFAALEKALEGRRI